MSKQKKPKIEKEVVPEHKIRCKTCQELKDETEFALRSDTNLRRNAYVAEFKRSEEQR